MLKAWGAHVTVTCSQNAERFVSDLGADHVVDYTAGPVEEPLSTLERLEEGTHRHTHTPHFSFFCARSTHTSVYAFLLQI